MDLEQLLSKVKTPEKMFAPEYKYISLIYALLKRISCMLAIFYSPLSSLGAIPVICNIEISPPGTRVLLIPRGKSTSYPIFLREIQFPFVEALGQ